MYKNLKKANDNMYVYEKNGVPYAVSDDLDTPQGMSEEFLAIQEWAEANPDSVGVYEPYQPSFEEAKENALSELEEVTKILRNRTSDFFGITVSRTYEAINEWLVFAKYKADPETTIPSQAVLMSYNGQNMNAFSAVQIEGAMYQAMLEITSINADYHMTLERINNATTIDELPTIILPQG